MGKSQNVYFVNLWGDNYQLKGLPDIGTEVNGIVAGSKVLYKNQILHDFKDSSMNTVDGCDKIYWGNGTVVDIEYFDNRWEEGVCGREGMCVCLCWCAHPRPKAHVPHKWIVNAQRSSLWSPQQRLTS